MIYAELAGGLGNQMFIYAFARALGKFGVDHACAPSLSYSSSMRRAAVLNS